MAQFDLQLVGPMRFQPGQFVVLESSDVPGGRAYSMVNFEPELDRLALVLKRKPGGRFTIGSLTRLPEIGRWRCLARSAAQYFARRSAAISSALRAARVSQA